MLLGIDCGTSAAKATLFDTRGVVVATGRRALPVRERHAGWRERGLDEVWAAVAACIGEVLGQAGGGRRVLAVGVCGHGDGVYLLDGARRPVRPAILPTDGRAAAIAGEIGGGPHAGEILRRSGQLPMAGSPASLMRWLAVHEPGALRRTRTLLACKDWIRLCLTGELATDQTDAAAAFTDVHTGRWSPELAELYRTPDVPRLLPPVLAPAAVAGTVTARAHRATGLPIGTPVVAGCHDVGAAAGGLDAGEPGTASLVLGTFCVAQVVVPALDIDARWQARPYLAPDRWLNMSTSGSGAGQLELSLARLGPWPDRPGRAAIVEAALAGGVAPDDPISVAFAFGGPFRHPAGSRVLGLEPRHGRLDLVRSVLEGISYNYRAQLHALIERRPVREIRVGGGGARSPGWVRLLCDALGVPVLVPRRPEPGGLGAARLAGVGVGVWPDVEEAGRATATAADHFEPDRVRSAILAERYGRWRRAVDGGAGARSTFV